MVLLIRLAAAVTLLTGCFSPALDGKFHCGTDGSCPPGLVCASDGVCRDDDATDAATPTAHDLATHDLAPACVKKMCAPGECGDALDGCGGKLTCGTCNGMAHVCGGGGMANVCGMGLCVPTTCQAHGATCGLISDSCSSVLDCGTCANGQTCGASNTCS